jgi:hypothetical protein
MSLPTPTELADYARNVVNIEHLDNEKPASYSHNYAYALLIAIIILLLYIIYKLSTGLKSLSNKIIMVKEKPIVKEDLTIGDLFTMNLSAFAEPFDDNDIPSGLSYQSTRMSENAGH